MNKSALKTFATNARRELLKKVEARAMKIGITEGNIKKADIESSDAIFIDGRQLSKEEKVQRDRLIDRINQMGFNRVMEEVAYTWFNRFTALRFMEVNDYIPTKVRVLSSANPDSTESDMMKDALSIDLDLDKEYIYDLKVNNKSEELFKYLIIKHCNDLNRYMPFMFKTDDYTEILFPEGLLAKDSFIRQMTNTEIIPEKNWRKVEVIGWLYQYYIAEEKDRVIHAKKKYKTEEIPFATQLFTPDWIVCYMVQNALGRYWIESHPEHIDLLGNWEYYLENPNPEPDFKEKLAPYINKDLKVEDIKCFDPAMGSGHILVYMFDVLYEIYSKCGYMEREIPRLIIENNLYGLDIDNRAYQLACFSVVMKALEYNSRFLRSIEREGLSINLASIQETNSVTDSDIAFFAGENSGDVYNKVKAFVNVFNNAKTLGSLIMVEQFDKELLEERLEYTRKNLSNDLFIEEVRNRVLSFFPKLMKQAEIMYRKFDILVTNPPYMGSKYMNPIFIDFMKKKYENSKSDTFSAFMEMSISKVNDNGHIGLVTPYVWMYISSYEHLRNTLVWYKNISSLIQLEYNSFPEATVPVCTFTFRNYNGNFSGEYIKLSDFKGSNIQSVKTLEAINNPEVSYRYTTNSNNFSLIPTTPIAFWASEQILKTFREIPSLSKFAEPKQGMATADNEMYLRMWTEVSFDKIGMDIENSKKAKESELRWFPYNKGGAFRKWYGNNYYVVDWENDGSSIRNNKKSVVRNPNYYFKKGLTWSSITSSSISFRYCDNGFLFDSKGPMCFAIDETKNHYLLALLNSVVSDEFLKILAPTMDFNQGPLGRVPVIFSNENEIENISKENISISKQDWDSYEISWDFKKHPLLLSETSLIEESYILWEEHTEKQFNTLKENEEKLNKYFMQIYQLEANNEVDFKVDNQDVSIRLANKEREIKSLISYIVGCLFGRYSLDKEGLIYAGGKFNPDQYQVFEVDRDNILPILPGTYFEDDIVSKIIEFIQITFGEKTLPQNLDFIADSLGRKKGETAKETLRRYFIDDFFSDHIDVYSTRGKKAPIYWLFTSGKHKAFNCLIYMQRYDKTTLSRIRTDYLHDYQNRLDAEKKNLLNIIEGDSTAKEISNAKKELKSLEKKIDELKAYDELLHHMADMQIEIDLDDGVKVNYEKFKGLVAKI
jgi:type II restriction/modification system DNA methylase subunit YeeA